MVTQSVPFTGAGNTSSRHKKVCLINQGRRMKDFGPIYRREPA
jgi:hypothetical protein